MCSTILPEHQDLFSWMQQSYNPYGFGALPDNFDHAASGPRDWSWNNADGNFNAQIMNQTVPSGQQNFRQHRRAPSTSTLASLGSNSPYSQPTSQPYSGSLDSGFYVDSGDNYTSQPSFPKHLPTPTRTPTHEGIGDRNKQPVYSNQAMAAHKAMRPVMMGSGSWNGDAMGFAPQGASHFNQELPHTPRTASIDEGDEQLSGASYPDSGTVSHIGRSISNTYEDELYSPFNQVAAAVPAQAQRPNSNNSMLSPHRNMLNLRLQEARSSASPAQSTDRELSPFRQNSPYATSEFSQLHGGMNTVARVREQQKAESDAAAYRQHHPQQEESQPKTISPKDAMLEFENDPDEPSEETVPSLFPENSASEERSYGPIIGRRQGGSNYHLPTSNFSFSSPSASANMQTPSFNKIGFPLQESHFSNDSNDDQPPDFPAHLVSMETSKSEHDPESHENSDIEKPTGSNADGGTYTCTYHGCTQRFSSPALLQKHKREGHRSGPGSSSRLNAQNLRQGSQRDGSSSPTSASFKNSQAGPHRCDRINPTTGKPCNTIFSRPYDLTRHEDTIHNNQKKKVRCHLCTEEKTFSRSDALTRHMRVVHPEVDFPGKHRKRGGAII